MSKYELGQEIECEPCLNVRVKAKFLGLEDGVAPIVRYMESYTGEYFTVNEGDIDVLVNLDDIRPAQLICDNEESLENMKNAYEQALLEKEEIERVLCNTQKLCEAHVEQIKEKDDEIKRLERIILQRNL